MKQTIIFLFVILHCLFRVHASSHPGIGDFSLSTTRFYQKGDSIFLQCRITGNAPIGKWQSYVVDCCLRKNDSLDRLDSFLLSGRYHYIHSQRKKQKIKVHKWFGNHPSVQYNASFPYTEQMCGAKAVFYFYKSDECCNSFTLSGTLSSEEMRMERLPVPAPYEMHFKYTFITPEAQPVKNRADSGSAFVEFPVGKSVLSVDFKNNRRELRKIQMAIDSIARNKYAVMEAINLTGYASIDGNSVTNRQLSQSRSEAVRNFLVSTYPSLRQNMIKIGTGGEDWQGLQTIADTTIYGKEIRSILSKPVSPYIWKTYLYKANKGELYRQISEKIFPSLRRVDYVVNYTVKSFTVEEGKDILKTSPGNLSLNELFLIANSYPAGSEDFKEVFDIAVRLYPQDPVARINAAGIALEKNDITRAERYLNGLENDSRALNNRALLEIVRGATDKGVLLLKKAGLQGDENACFNMEEYTRNEQREQERKEIIQKNKSNHEEL